LVQKKQALENARELDNFNYRLAERGI